MTRFLLIRWSGIAALALAVGVTVSACSVGVGYEPPETPLEFSVMFSISPDGIVSVEGSVGIITDVGIFSIHAGVQFPVNPKPDQTILAVRHWRSGRLVDSVYSVNSGEQVAVTLNGHSVVRVLNQRVSISVARGSTASIQVDSAPVSLAENQLKVGYCLRGANLQFNIITIWPDEVTGIPCDEAHTAEVYHLGQQWPANEKWPGSKVVNNQGKSACASAFKKYVGMAPRASKYSYIYVTPGPASEWSSGDRQLVCVLYWYTRSQPDGATLYGSAKGSAQ